MEYPFIEITPRSPLTRSRSTCSGPVYESNRTVQWFIKYYYLADGFSLEFEWQQVSRTLPGILAVLNNAVSTRPPTSKSYWPSNNPLVTVPWAPITIGTIVTFMLRCFFNSLARSRYLSFFSHSFSFILWSAGTAKSTILQILFFVLLLIIIRSGLLAEIIILIIIIISYYHY